MEIIKTYQIIILPITAALLAQILKFITKKHGEKFGLKSVVAYSGMPSGHSALVVSLATTLGLANGLSSSSFAISLVLAIIVIRDALGIRRYLGEHGHILNVLVKELKNDNLLDQKYPHLLENIGHTPLQALAGSIVGIIVSLVGYLALN